MFKWKLNMNKIDFNCDLGEGFGRDIAIMPYISSCNIACGGHAGNETTIRETLSLAKKYQVNIGAHPSYPDPENFGRKILQLSPLELTQSLVDQIKLLEAITSTLNLGVQHIKLHGALYHQAARDTVTAQLIINMMKSCFPHYMIYVPHPSVLSLMAHEQGVQIKYEAFADRKYNTDLSLVSREHAHAVLLNSEEVIEQVERIITEGRVKSITGDLVSLKAHTICLHGDHPKAPELAAAIHQLLRHHGSTPA
jgi:UPF0271 protein